MHGPTDIVTLEEMLSRPTARLVELFRRLEGDLLILGVGGKMGPSLARMARRASDAAGTARRVIGVSRFSDPSAEQALRDSGVETIRGDLLDERFVDSLPDAANVVCMFGRKFGTAGAETLTWATNTYLPALVCRRYLTSRILAFSTGNVYGLVPVGGGGSKESDSLGPIGEYATSALGRERIYTYFSKDRGVRMSIIRLNYATEMRYGVLVDLAQQVYRGEPISVAMGFANVIWQADASAMSLTALEYASSPPSVFNVTGPERFRTQDVCRAFAERMDRSVTFVDQEGPTALLSNPRLAVEKLGPPEVALEQLIDWTARWILRGGETWSKPTHFGVVDGTF